MSERTVLVVTRPGDVSADLVVAELARHDIRIVRFDPGDPAVALAVELGGRRNAWRGFVRDEHRAFSPEDVTGVFWRWPTRPAGHPALTDPGERAWAAEEDHAAVHGMLRSVPARWINHPGRVSAAEHKPVQLAAARAAGLSVPPTLVTTSGRAARAWAAGHDVLYKAFHANGPDDAAMIYAARIEPDALPAVLGTACTFQQVIDGDHIRATVVGAQVFAATVHGAADLDWRATEDADFTPVPAPPTVHRRILRFMAAFRLEYGAFDFVRDRRGDWVFLECNPTGMWGFLEFATNAPIAAANR
jgi:hypothetical protein